MITELLKIKYPIIQAPMALADSPLLAATVSNQGGLGSFGAALCTPDQIREKIQEIKQLTQNPFAINLFAPTTTQNYSADEVNHAIRLLNYFRKKLGITNREEIQIPPAANFEEKLNILIEEKIPIFSFTFGVLTKEIIQRVKSHGIVVIGTATTVREAQQLEQNGVDMVVAQGYEAGGHRGTDLSMTNIQHGLIGTITLVPQIVDAVKIPVIASGGIMDSRGMNAAFALGASGVQMGTAFLCCPESNIHAMHRKKLLASTDESTRLTNVFTGRMARSIVNEFMLEMEKQNFPILDFPIQSQLVKDIRDAAQKQNNSDYMSLWAGQGSHLCQNKSAADVFKQLIANMKAMR